MKRYFVLSHLLIIVGIVLLLFSACQSETPQEKANREAHEAWQAYQDANDAYERARQANDDFQNAINDYYNAHGGN